MIKGKKMLTIIGIICATISSLIVPSSAYSSTSAVTYANTYALSYNSYYRSFAGSGGDCANFVSQCIRQGGMAMDGTWYYTKRSNVDVGLDQCSIAWKNANAFKNYIKNNVGAPILAPKWKKVQTSTNYAYVNNSSNITTGDGGKVIVYYDWYDDGIIDHTAIVVGTGNDSNNDTIYGDLVDAHTHDRKKVVWTLDPYNAYRAYTAVYAFRLPY